ncbi:WD40-repeat-containing domain superfamily [Babesia duncani]|uniref:WD40-repeat-containing domain superfamily n=1 Tax=Babesia duncani TaxID=323732 RepID=A0AAD9UMG1_9APIC|nr:WD40-repeat-containing domain superfamily [Babesia duncani]KAK2195993.1 WD40-repeat-containing domain superfamily [Babesia duncani]
MGGYGFSALAVSTDGKTIATASDEAVYIYPEMSIWIPSIALPIPNEPTLHKEQLQGQICRSPNCICKQSYTFSQQQLQEHILGDQKKPKKNRIPLIGIIQHLCFFGRNNELLIGVGRTCFMMYDLMSLSKECILAFDIRFLGFDSQWQSSENNMQFYCAILDVNRNSISMHGYEELSCIEFLFSIRPFVPMYFKVFFNEQERWYAFDCQNSCPIVPTILQPCEYAINDDDAQSSNPSIEELEQLYKISFKEYFMNREDGENQNSINQYTNTNEIFTKQSPFYPCCLLRYVDHETAKESPEETELSITRDYYVAMWMPLNRIIIIKFIVTSVWTFLKDQHNLSIGPPTSYLLTSLALAGAFPGKVTSLVPKIGGNVFCVMAIDRFYILTWSIGTQHTLTEHIIDDGSEQPEFQEDKLVLKYAHHDQVSKLRYTISAFTCDNGDGYFSTCCTNPTNNWGLYIFDLKYSSGVEAIRLVLDISKCKGFTHIEWVPQKSRLAVLSGYHGEFYLLEPKVCRNWAQMIPNFAAIEKNIEIIETEEEFDVKKEEPSTSVPGEIPQTTPADAVAPTKDEDKAHYPFYHVGYALAGDDWQKIKAQDMEGFNDEPILHDNEALTRYKGMF